MPGWFLLLDTIPLPAAVNMARDEFLFQLCHHKKMGIFRLYSWEQPSFSFGVSQKINKAIDIDFLQQNHCAFVRRITGGKTVLHADEITYSVISSHDTFYKEHDLYKSYLLISTVLVNAFQRIGVDAYLSPGPPPKLSRSLSRSSNPCFSFPTPNELEINGKKIVGSAQKRDKYALLQHGSIPISMDYNLYALGTRTHPDLIKNAMTTLSSVSDKNKIPLQEALVQSFQEFIGSNLEEFHFEDIHRQQLSDLEHKYRSQEWNFKL